MNLFESLVKTFGFKLKDEKPKGQLEALDIDHEDGSTEIVSPFGRYYECDDNCLSNTNQ